jgi:hypothetical protein
MMQLKLDTWNADIEALSGSTCNATTRVRNSTNKQIESLKSKLAAAWEKIEMSACVQRTD